MTCDAISSILRAAENVWKSELGIGAGSVSDGTLPAPIETRNPSLTLPAPVLTHEEITLGIGAGSVSDGTLPAPIETRNPSLTLPAPILTHEEITHARRVHSGGDGCERLTWS